MTIREKYRLKKRIKNFLIFYLFVCILFIVSYTLSRYVAKTEGNGGMDIAKFNVTINDINVQDGIPIQFNFSESSTFLNKKIAPNNEGYFEFVINPNQTEVSLEYEFKFNLEELDEDFKLAYFTINDNERYDIDKDTLKNDLLLKTNERGFTDNDSITKKFIGIGMN